MIKYSRPLRKWNYDDVPWEDTWDWYHRFNEKGETLKDLAEKRTEETLTMRQYILLQLQILKDEWWTVLKHGKSLLRMSRDEILARTDKIEREGAGWFEDLESLREQEHQDWVVWKKRKEIELSKGEQLGLFT